MSNHPGPWFCATTTNHGDNDLRDTWSVHSDEAEARAAYDDALKLDNLHCACIGPIITATEWHWTKQGAV